MSLLEQTEQLKGDTLASDLGDLIDLLNYQIIRLRDTSRDPSLSHVRKVAARIAYQRIDDTFRSLIRLIEKIEQRPVLLDRARRVLAAADEAWICRELIRELGAMRTQDREFDRDLDEIYQQAREKLRALTGQDMAEQESAL
ncbi:MAG: hypothetical protein L0Z53_15055 [Acidobacteriales bacterium]|nr:hypothetical protein [Terriglobales bacterium]